MVVTFQGAANRDAGSQPGYCLRGYKAGIKTRKEKYQPSAGERLAYPVCYVTKHLFPFLVFCYRVSGVSLKNQQDASSTYILRNDQHVGFKFLIRA